jgi:hypothetical protein
VQRDNEEDDEDEEDDDRDDFAQSARKSTSSVIPAFDSGDDDEDEEMQERHATSIRNDAAPSTSFTTSQYAPSNTFSQPMTGIQRPASAAPIASPATQPMSSSSSQPSSTALIHSVLRSFVEIHQKRNSMLMKEQACSYHLAKMQDRALRHKMMRGIDVPFMNVDLPFDVITAPPPPPSRE